jgi:AcrR family transcriptional regulator
VSDLPTFERARRPEHKEQRRAAILSAARTLGAERGVRAVTLGDIAAATGMAKSNVLRYFGTREEIYLDLMIEAWNDWLASLISRLEGGAISGPAAAAHAVAESLADRTLLCDLISQMATTLEHNVRPEHGRDFKVAMFAGTAELGTALRSAMPDLTNEQAFEVGIGTGLAIGSIWSTCTTPPEILELLDPALIERLPGTFGERLERMLRALYVGLPLT